jgi:hypothetical protein
VATGEQPAGYLAPAAVVAVDGVLTLVVVVASRVTLVVLEVATAAGTLPALPLGSEPIPIDEVDVGVLLLDPEPEPELEPQAASATASRAAVATAPVLRTLAAVGRRLALSSDLIHRQG